METKKIIKNIISALLMLAIIFSFNVTNVFAASTNVPEPSARLDATNQVTFSHLDNVKVGEKVEYEVTDSNGNPAVISIELVNHQSTRNAQLKSPGDDLEHGKFPILEQL